MVKQEEAYEGQAVIWVRQFPWSPMRCKIVAVYTYNVRVGFNQRSHDPLKHNRYKEQDVSIRRLVPDTNPQSGLNELELKRQLNPRYKKRPAKTASHDDWYYDL